MKNLIRLIFLVFASPAPFGPAVVQGQPTNLPPSVSLAWPTQDGCVYTHVFSPGTFLKIKTDATDPDGSIAEVRFYNGEYLIGVATNAPFSIVWESAGPPGSGVLKAVAVDNLGAATESAFVHIYFSVGPVLPPVLDIKGPVDGSVFAAPGMFEITAELLSSPNGDTGPVQFYAGTNSVGTVTQSGPFTVATSSYSLTVTNLLEGSYQLNVVKDGVYSGPWCSANNIRVTKLGMHFPRTTSDNRFQFDVVTTFPTNPNAIEVSSNLLNWTAISTNVPMTSSFTFTEPSPATNSPRYYRAVVGSQ